MAGVSKINLLVGSKEVGNAIERYIKYVMGIGLDQTRVLFMGGAARLSRDILDADLWIAEVWNPTEPNNPEGFRTMSKLAGTARCLLLFLLSPKGFPPDGPFWCTLPIVNLKEKIKSVMDSAPPGAEDYQRLIGLWPALSHDPSRHAHHIHGHRE